MPCVLPDWSGIYRCEANTPAPQPVSAPNRLPPILIPFCEAYLLVPVEINIAIVNFVC